MWTTLTAENQTDARQLDAAHSRALSLATNHASAVLCEPLHRFIEPWREFVSSRTSLLIQGESDLHRYLVMSNFAINNLTANLRYLKPA
jgi:hypothetical protein